MNNTEFPRLRIEVDSVKDRVIHMFSLQHGEMQRLLEEVIEEEMSPEKIHAMMREKVRLQMTAAVSSQIEHFFKWGDGAKLVKSLVEDSIKKELGMTGGGS